MNRNQITKIFATKKQVISFTLDPRLETADIDLVNNHWPRKMIQSKFELYKSKNYNRGTTSKENKMQRKIRADKKLEKRIIKINYLNMVFLYWLNLNFFSGSYSVQYSIGS